METKVREPSLLDLEEMVEDDAPEPLGPHPHRSDHSNGDPSRRVHQELAVFHSPTEHRLDGCKVAGLHRLR